MDEVRNRAAATANSAAYGAEGVRTYCDAASHLKHAATRHLYASLAIRAFDAACRYTAVPTVLDLGAGEGSATLPFLELGARVTAVDVSQHQMDALRNRCSRFGTRLETRCEDVNDTLLSAAPQYDIVIANSFLHHVPDYLGLIRRAIARLAPHGQFFSFQDPLRYDTLGTATRLYSSVAYLSWRIFKGDLIGGAKRRLRRTRGVYLEDSTIDCVEYHAMRNGVDQEAIRQLFEDEGFDFEIVSYFSTQNRLFQVVGTSLGIKNMFSVRAERMASSHRDVYSHAR